MTIWALIVLALLGIVLGAAGPVAGPRWVARYFGVMVAPLLLLGGARVRARPRGRASIAIVLDDRVLRQPGLVRARRTNQTCSRWPAQLGPLLHPGDAVAVAQPEQTPLAYYYLPAGLRWSTTLGPVAKPSVMNWSGAYGRLQDAAPSATLGAVVASLKPGQQLLFVRPLTEGVMNWKAPWASSSVGVLRSGARS